MSAHVLARVAKLIAEDFGVDAASITEATELDALGLDSMDRIELAMSVEDDFGISVPHVVEFDWKTVGDVIRYLEAAGLDA